MHVLNRKQAFTSPDTVFPSPRAVVSSTGLTADEKVVVLRNWKAGLKRLQKAGRGTPRQDGSGDLGPRLEDVDAAMIELDHAWRS